MIPFCKASIIISIYKDTVALNAILSRLNVQTEKNFEVIIAEDGESSEVAEYLRVTPFPSLKIKHTTQEDNGWRKMSAVNKAVAKAESEYLIFLDGDCIPHSRHVETHLAQQEPGKILTGRRVYLGPFFSKWTRQNPDILNYIENRFLYLLAIIPLHLDKVKCYELGLRSYLLHKRAKHRHVSIVGCNFSLSMQDMLDVNGYDENLVGPGAEDDDLAIRLRAMGKSEKSVKFITPTYHLNHKVNRQGSEKNKEITAESLKNKQFYTLNGIDKYLK
ncbi:glycosyltransferase [Psychromonas aquimarina]|uniref:glycosyltransferase n=1 Tax=Psychromonas aquimarina TaxID=444919 RepID=UPI0003F9DC01|nr:glycosyltransferase [Psychromonas aquimarina]